MNLVPKINFELRFNNAMICEKSTGLLRFILIVFSATLLGCISSSDDSTSTSNAENCDPEIVMVYDTTFISDTIVIFTGPVIPDAPYIVDAKKEYSYGSYFVNFIASPTKSAVGYKCYVSTLLEGPYVEVEIVSLKMHDQYVEFTDVVDQEFKGNRFYKISAVNNNGIEGEKSPHRLVYFN